MTHFPLIKMISYGLYAFIIIHTIQGLALWSANRKAKGQTYAVKTRPEGVTWASGNMALLGTLILAFLIIHMAQFWGQMHFGDVSTKAYAGFAEGEPIKDLYTLVADAFKNPAMIALYVVGQAVLAFHLWHGFQSAFQTIGVNHPKYTPFIKGFGKAFSIIVPLGFAAIPVIFYLTH
jgi:succinate dehydrogenase / fumarate reductase cytochrome b subunit